MNQSLLVVPNKAVVADDNAATSTTKDHEMKMMNHQSLMVNKAAAADKNATAAAKAKDDENDDEKEIIRNNNYNNRGKVEDDEEAIPRSNKRKQEEQQEQEQEQEDDEEEEKAAVASNVVIKIQQAFVRSALLTRAHVVQRNIMVEKKLIIEEEEEEEGKEKEKEEKTETDNNNRKNDSSSSSSSSSTRRSVPAEAATATESESAAKRQQQEQEQEQEAVAGRSRLTGGGGGGGGVGDNDTTSLASEDYNKKNKKDEKDEDNANDDSRLAGGAGGGGGGGGGGDDDTTSLVASSEDYKKKNKKDEKDEDNANDDIRLAGGAGGGGGGGEGGDDDTTTSLVTSSEDYKKKNEEEEEENDDDDDPSLWESTGTLDCFAMIDLQKKSSFPLDSPTLDSSSLRGKVKKPLLLSLEEIATVFEDSVPVFDRRYYFKVYPQTFIGTEAVDFLVRSQYATSRSNAVQIGIQMQLEMNLFEHVPVTKKKGKNQNHQHNEFADMDLFYRFIDPTQRRTSCSDADNINSNNNNSSHTDPLQQEIYKNNNNNNKAIRNSSSSRYNYTLDEMAIQLRNNLNVKDRYYHLKKYPKCFVTSDAIDFMLHRGMASSRGDAVAIGRRLTNEFDLWHHVVHYATKEFDDSYLFFRFKDDNDNDNDNDIIASSSSVDDVATPTKIMPTTATTTSKNIQTISEEEPNDDDDDDDILQTKDEENDDDHHQHDVTVDKLEEIGKQLRQSLKLKTKTCKLKKYKNCCFLASDVVDFLLHNTELANSRNDAIKLGQRLGNELKLWQILGRQQQQEEEIVTFQDDHIWLYFVNNNEADNNDNNNENQSEHNNESSSVSSSSRQDLIKIAEKLRRRLNVKNRWYHLKLYRNCFIASDAVDFMIRSKFADSRKEAVELGQRLQQELGIWYHVTGDHYFKDEYLFFRFSKTRNNNNNNTIGGAGNSIMGSDTSSRLGGSSTSSSSHYHYQKSNGGGGDLDSESSSKGSSNSRNNMDFLQYAGEQLRQGVQVRDRMYHLRTYGKVFVGSEAVDFFVQSRLVSSREEAVELGQHLAAETGLFHHVTNAHTFKDEYLFYRFHDDDSSSRQQQDDNDVTSESSLSNYSEEPYTATSGSATTSHTQGSYSLRGADMSFEEIAKELRNNVQVKTRKYRLKEYRNCLIGSEAVDYMVQSRIVATRENAVELIRQATSELQFITHVCGDHIFKDDYLFYRFTAIDRKSGSNQSRSSRCSVVSTLRRSMESFTSAVSQEHLVLDGALDRSRENNVLSLLLKESQNKSKMVLVHGPCGSGKTQLITDYFDSQVHRLVFASSSFMLENSMVPFSTLRALFRDLWEKLRTSHYWRDGIASIQEELQEDEPSKRILAQWIPDSAKFLLDEASETLEMVESSLAFKKDNATGAKMALLALLRAISRVCPVVLFLDDIMWAEEPCLRFLEFLITRADFPNIVFCFAYQDEEVDENHKVMLLKDVLDAEEGNGVTLQLKDMSSEEVTAFLKQVLRLEEIDVFELSLVVLDRTNGNLSSVICLLEALQSRALLRYEYSRMEWSFSVKEIRKVTTASGSIVALLADRLRTLPASCLEVLKLASCFGGYLNVDLIERSKSILSIDADVETCLHEACWGRILIQQSEQEYKFACSNLQLIAYEMLPEGTEREKIHWEIGCKLLKSRSQDEGTVFACVDQLKKGLSFLQDSYRLKVAAASLRAGYRATGLSAFIIGSGYFKMGIDVLGERAFIDNHGLAVDLYTSYAETLLVAGDIQGSREAAEKVLKHASNLREKQVPSLTLLRCHKADLNLEMEIKLGVEILSDWGVEFPGETPPIEQVVGQLEKATSCMKALSLDDVYSLPPMTCSKMEFCMTIMFSIVDSGLQLGRPMWVCFLLGELVQMTMKYGYCKLTPLIVVFFATDIVHNQSLFDDAHKYIQIALQLQEENPSDQHSCVLLHASYLLSTIEPLTRSMYIALEAYRVGMEAGQINYAFEAYGIYCWSFFYSGLPFEPLIQDMENYINQMIDYKRQSAVFHTPLWQTLLNLSGRSNDPTSLATGEAIEKNRNLPLTSTASGDEAITNYSMQLSFYFGDMENATECYEKLKNMNTIGFADTRIVYQVQIYFFCLICIENFRRTQTSA